MKKLTVLLLSLFALVACGNDSGDVADSAKISCADGYSAYEIEGTPMEICYNQAWGMPAATAETTVKGKAYVVNFADASDGPSIWYGTKDYEGADGAEKICFDCFNLYGNQELVDKSVVEALGLQAGEFKARKTDAGGRRGIRVHADGSVAIYVPDAFDEYNMMIFGDESVAEEVDEMAFDMQFGRER